MNHVTSKRASVTISPLWRCGIHFVRSTGRIHIADDLAEFVAIVGGPPRAFAYVRTKLPPGAR